MLVIRACQVPDRAISRNPSSVAYMTMRWLLKRPLSWMRNVCGVGPPVVLHSMSMTRSRVVGGSGGTMPR